MDYRPRGTNKINELARHINKNLAKGYSVETLRWALVSEVYSRFEISKALEIIEQERKEEQERQKEMEKPKITYDNFEENGHLYKTIDYQKPWWKRLFGL